MKKRILMILSLLSSFSLLLSAACGGGKASVSESDSASDSGSSAEQVKSPWTSEPTVKSVFYSDFVGSENVSENWSLVNYGWGQNGVAKENAGYTRSPKVINALGATGGVVVLNSYGNYYKEAGRRGQGGVLISNRLFGPGKYEVRMKVVPRFGPCSTAWSYYTNSYAINNAAGNPVYGHNTSENIQYHEIDIECPQIGNGFNGWGGVAYEEFYQNAEDLNEKGEGKTVNRSQGVGAPCESPYNDGQWHTFAFDWRTTAYDYDEGKGENPGAVVWYMDGKEVARTAKNTPYYPNQLWIGNWFPNNSEDWLGVADFDSAYMYVDWVRITEYDDEYRTTNKSDGSVIKPDLNGCVTFSTSGGNINYGANIPINNYISNGKFELSDGKDGALGWSCENAVKDGDKLVFSGTGKATQMIAAQYGGYEFHLEAAAKATKGACRIYIEYIKGEYDGKTNSNKKMTPTVVGKSEEIAFTTGGNPVETLEFKIPEKLGINNFRVVIETENGAVAEVTELKMYLKSDMSVL